MIMKFLHFVDNTTEIDTANHPQPKLWKIWHVFEMINDRFLSVYTPERDVAVDESLLLYKGRLSWKQYLPLKRARFGLKFFLLCESESGYVSNVILYTGKGTVDSDQLMCMGTKVVFTLLAQHLDRGYCLTVDNFYCSPELVDALITRKTDVHGTVRATRKDICLSQKRRS